MYSYGSPHMAAQKQDDQIERTFSSYVRIRDVVLKTYLGRWTIGRSGERGSGISVLPVRYDDDDDDDLFIISFSFSKYSFFSHTHTHTHTHTHIYIYIYVYIYIYKGVRSTPNECPGYYIKSSDVEAIVLELWLMWSNPLLLFAPWFVLSQRGRLERVISICQIELCDI